MKIIKTILLDEVVIKNNDFHLFERLIKDACGLKIKVIRLLPTELPVQKAMIHQDVMMRFKKSVIF